MQASGIIDEWIDSRYAGELAGRENQVTTPRFKQTHKHRERKTGHTREVENSRKTRGKGRILLDHNRSLLATHQISQGGHYTNP